MVFPFGTSRAGPRGRGPSLFRIHAVFDAVSSPGGSTASATERENRRKEATIFRTPHSAFRVPFIP